jgi:hypothetical protein
MSPITTNFAITFTLRYLLYHLLSYVTQQYFWLNSNKTPIHTVLFEYASMDS